LPGRENSAPITQMGFVAHRQLDNIVLHAGDASTPKYSVVVICFLDIHMPGLSGIEVAHRIGQKAHVVFVTAFDDYAVQAFEQGAIDYLVKPVVHARLLACVARLQDRLKQLQPPPISEALLTQLADRLRTIVPAVNAHSNADSALRFIRASSGSTVRLIACDDIDFLRAESKYTLVAWRGEQAEPLEALIRMPLKDLLMQLKPSQFAQVHRSIVVNLHSIREIRRGDPDSAQIVLKSRKEILPVSRSYLHIFKQM
jgi:DNA-binding LytR/AlgR family response regulator